MFPETHELQTLLTLPHLTGMEITAIEEYLEAPDDWGGRLNSEDAETQGLVADFARRLRGIVQSHRVALDAALKHQTQPA